jgi:hypothetical protein
LAKSQELPNLVQAIGIAVSGLQARAISGSKTTG